MKIKVGKLQTRAKFDIASYSAENNTIEVVFATETTDVMRYDWRHDLVFKEQLVLEKKAVRMERINAGAPFLNSHDRYSGVDAVLGVVESAEVKNKEGRAVIRLSQREDFKNIIADIKSGILRNVSVGYTVYKYERQSVVVDGETPIYRAIDWEPSEISLVSVPADYKSGVRGKASGNENEAVEIELVNEDGSRVEEKNTENSKQKNSNNNLKTKNMKLAERAKAVGLPETATLEEVVRAEKLKKETEKTATEAGKKAELERQKAIRSEVSKSKLPIEFAERLIDEDKNIDQARALIIDELAAKKDPTINGSGARVTGEGEDEKRIKGITAALLSRSGDLTGEKLSDEEATLSKEYRGLTLMDIAREELERKGVNTRGLGKMELAKRALSSHSSDFPVLLEGVNRRVLLAAYKHTPDTWRQFCAIGSVGDFREYKRLRPGSLTSLDELLEGAEYKNKKMSDATAEKVSVLTYGNTINITRQMIINDDLGAFTQISKTLGRAAARGIEEKVYALLALNGGAGPTLNDGIALFHADHKNLIDVGSGGAPSVTEFDDVRQLMMKQTDNDANEFLDIRPSIGLFPVNLGGLARVINDSKYDPDAANKLERANMVSGMLSNIIDTPRLTEVAPWYVFADPSDEPVIEVSFLDGEQNPFMESEVPFDVDGLRWKVRHDYGVGAVGYRGAVKNAGA